MGVDDRRGVAAGVHSQMQRNFAGRLQRDLHHGAFEVVDADELSGQVGVVQPTGGDGHQIVHPYRDVAGGTHHEAVTAKVLARGGDLGACVLEQQLLFLSPAAV